MKTELWTCDFCGAELPKAPALQACIVEPATGTILFAHDNCQGCLDKFIATLDPDGSKRKEWSERLGRSLQFKAFPQPMKCSCKSPITCAHGGS